MKNLIIAILASFIYYTHFCVVKMPIIMPCMTFIVWAILSEIDIQIEDFNKSKKRGEKLINSLRGYL